MCISFKVMNLCCLIEFYILDFEGHSKKYLETGFLREINRGLLFQQIKNETYSEFGELEVIALRMEDLGQ